MLNKIRFWTIAIVVVGLMMPMLVMGQDAVQIAYGQTVTGEISTNNPSDSYSFFGNQGDTILIRMNATGGSNLDSFLRLLDPRGLDFYSDDDSGGNRNALLGPVTLGETGTYTVVASSCCTSEAANSTGTYELVVEEAVVPQVALNQPVPFELGDSNPVAFFSLLADDVPSQLARVAVNLTGGDTTGANIGIEVRGPIGGYFYSQYAPSGSNNYVVDPVITDLAGGAYMIIVRLFTDRFDSPLPSVSAEIVATATNATRLDLNAPLSGQLNDANPSAYYVFDANMGDILKLSGTQPADSHPIGITVFAPGGISFTGASSMDYMDGSSTGSFIIDPLRILNTGTYYAFITRAIYNNPNEVIGATSAFTISLETTATPMLQAGDVVTGVFDDPSEYAKTYRYQATANQTIRITLTSLNIGYAPSFDLQGEAFESPDMMLASHNAMVPGTVIFEVTLYYDSIYILNVRNGLYFPMGDSAGEFSLRIDVIE